MTCLFDQFPHNLKTDFYLLVLHDITYTYLYHGNLMTRISSSSPKPKMYSEHNVGIHMKKNVRVQWIAFLWTLCPTYTINQSQSWMRCLMGDIIVYCYSVLCLIFRYIWREIVFAETHLCELFKLFYPNVFFTHHQERTSKLMTYDWYDNFAAILIGNGVLSGHITIFAMAA